MNAPNRLAKTISLFTNPALVVTVVIPVVVQHYTDSNIEFWRGSLLGFGLLVLPGLLYSIYIWKKEGAVDLDLTERHDRIVPLMLSSLGAVIGSFLIQSRLHNQTFTELSYILVMVLVSLTVVTTVWKISLHAATISALTSLLVLYRGGWFIAGYLLLVPVIWSRLQLKQHTPYQLVGGTILGTSLTFLVGWLLTQYR